MRTASSGTATQRTLIPGAWQDQGHFAMSRYFAQNQCLLGIYPNLYIFRKNILQYIYQNLIIIPLGSKT